MTPGLKMGWAVDFLDNPNEGLEFRYWSGAGDLTIGTGADAVTYQGTNGVIDITAPEERSGEAMRLTAIMDATNADVREQLRHDMGPLRVRIRWLYYALSVTEEVSRTLPSVAVAYTTELVFNNTGEATSLETGDVIRVKFTNDGGSSAVNTTDIYWGRVLNAISASYKSIAIFRTKAEADAANNNNYATGGGRLNLNGGGFQASAVVMRVIDVEGGASEYRWTASGKEFIGRLSSPVLEGAKFTVDIESQISDILRGRVLNWSNDMQQARHPGDKGMEYLAEYAEGIDTKWPP